MNPDRWQRLQTLFNAAVEMRPDQRGAYLADACDDDLSLARQVESLLLSSDEAGEFIEGAVQEAAASAARADMVGRRIGAYEVVGELGHGGMGTVYLARRADAEYESLVAIKLVRGVHSASLLGRFRSERQILATLNHPNIASLLDGGTTPEGYPYVVMEHVDGKPIDQFCDERQLTIEKRLDLFRTVCLTVQYAHRNLVVHRDLKPSNILVTRAGVPKLLDFGIAKLLDPGVAEHTVVETGTATRLLTPSYASPEQVRGENITVATDVYSLGIVLYELLTGHVPFHFRGRGVLEIERVVCEEEPTRPSTVVTRDVDTGETKEGPPKMSAAELSRARNIIPDRLRRRLAGDLDTMVLKALRKEPNRRYESADQFAEDVRRHLEGLPVNARGDTWTYRAGKFVRRHRVGVASAATFVLVLVGFATSMAVQARRIARERDVASLERAKAEQVSDFMVELFQVSDPSESRGNSITAREILDEGAARVADELTDQPEIQASMMNVMGEVYKSLGLYAEAATLLDSTLAIRRRVLGEEHPDVAVTLLSLGQLRYETGLYEEAEQLYRRALDIQGQAGSDETDIARTKYELAALLDEQRFDGAEDLYREALATDRGVYGDDDPTVADDLTALGGLLRRKGMYPASESLLVEGLDIRRRHLGDDHLDVGHSLNQLARLYTLWGRHEDALPLALEGLEIRRLHFGDHAEVAASLGNVAGIQSNLGDHAASELTRLESLEMLQRIFGDDHPYVAGTMNSLADVRYAKGDLVSAEATYRRALELHRSHLPPGSPNLGYPLTGLGRVLMDLDRFGEAEVYLREAVEVRTAALGEDHWHVAASASALGACLVSMGRYEEAERYLLSSLSTLETTFGDEDRRSQLARERVVRLYEASGQANRAAEFRAGLADASLQ